MKCDEGWPGWVKNCQQLMVAGKAGRRRGRKTWLECVRRYQRGWD